MGPKYCVKHGFQPFISTSPRLAEAISSNQSVTHDDIRYLDFDLFGRNFRETVDPTFLENFGLPSHRGVVVLKDRDKNAKQLNDRLLIQKITKEMISVCPPMS